VLKRPQKPTCHYNVLLNIFFAADVDVPEGSGPMAFLLAKAGITPDMFETVG
jgi:hypothetical protein